MLRRQQSSSFGRVGRSRSEFTGVILSGDRSQIEADTNLGAHRDALGEHGRKMTAGALGAGVSAFLPKTCPAHQLREAFEQILDGDIYISPSIELEEIFNSEQEAGPADPLDALSAREYQVFFLLVQGTRQGNRALAPS